MGSNANRPLLPRRLLRHLQGATHLGNHLRRQPLHARIIVNRITRVDAKVAAIAALGWLGWLLRAQTGESVAPAPTTAEFTAVRMDSRAHTLPNTTMKLGCDVADIGSAEKHCVG